MPSTVRKQNSSALEAAADVPLRSRRVGKGDREWGGVNRQLRLW
jgi:hypothetical protein